jgi:hypothetical protein
MTRLGLLILGLGGQVWAQTPEVVRGPVHGPKPEVVREIKILTADRTLLPIVRSHDLVKVFDLPDEAAAVVRLRGMLDLIEEPEGKAMEIGVLGDDPALAESLTHAVADASEAQRANQRGDGSPVTREEASARLKQQEEIVEKSRITLMQLMKEFSVADFSGMEPRVGQDGQPGQELPPAFVRAKRFYEQQLAVLRYDRETSPPLLETPRTVLKGNPAQTHSKSSPLMIVKWPVPPVKSPPNLQPLTSVPAPASLGVRNFLLAAGVALGFFLLGWIRLRWTKTRPH